MTRLISYEIKAKQIYLTLDLYSLCPCQYVSLGSTCSYFPEHLLRLRCFSAMRKFPCDYNHAETIGCNSPTYTKTRSGTVFQSLDCGKTLKLNYDSIYYRFFKGIKFSNPQMTVLALDE